MSADSVPRLTDRQAAILETIRRSIRERGFPPTIREIARATGIKSTNGVNDHLVALERKGFVRREAVVARGLSLTVPGQTELEKRREELRAELSEIEQKLSEVSNAA